MDVIFLFVKLVPVVLAFVIGILAFKSRRSSGNSKDMQLPPGSFGLPIIGETLHFLLGKPEIFVIDRMNKYSPDIFKTKIFGEKTVVLCGPTGHKFLFSNEYKVFAAFQPNPMQKLFQIHDGDPVQFARHELDVTSLLKTPALGLLKPDALVRHLGKVDTIIEQQIQTYWEGKDEVKVYSFSRRLTLSLACSILLGTNDPDRITRLVKNFDDITDGMHSIPVNVPGTLFYRANKAAVAIRNELMDLINEKKGAMATRTATAQDPLSYMLTFTDSSGRHLREVDISNKILGILVAGYSTVANAMAFFMKYVGERSDIYDKVLSEQKEISAAKKTGDLLEWDDIQKMKYSWNVVNEVMRVTPPVQGGFRKVTADFTFCGYTVPKGWKVYWNMSTAQKNPEYFTDPEKFDPSRNNDDDKVISHFTFVPFGGGPRTCPGKEYARLVILTFVYNVMKRFKWELACPDEKIGGHMMPFPEKGLPIRLLPRPSYNN